MQNDVTTPCHHGECGTNPYARGMCKRHYERWRRKDPGQRTFPEQERFWSKVDKSGDCWFWTGHRGPGGYGNLKVGSRLEPSNPPRHEKAHRYAYALAYGPIPEGMDVCHRCDNPPCVRAEHLFAGTALDNMRDMIAKGRQPAAPKGERNPAAKLTESQVEEIRRRYKAGGISQTALGSEYGVAQAHISHIVLGKVWR